MSRLQVIAAEDGQVPAPGCVYVASNEPGLLITEGRLRFQPKTSVHNPVSKDALFCSMARDNGPGAIAVILDQMGPDGATGMKEVRDAGGYTIVQDRSSSIVYGTAEVAVELNAACESLPLTEVAPRLVSLIAPGSQGLNQASEFLSKQ